MTIALSHSRLSDFQQCPLKFKLKYIDKAQNFQLKQEEKNIHLIRGDNVHKALDEYLLLRKDGKAEGEIPKTSQIEVENTKPIIENYIDTFGIDNVHPEAQIAINKDWQQVDWFDKNAYYRVIFDMICKSTKVVVINDYKTGKFKDYAPDGYGQLELSAAIAFSIWKPEVIKTNYLYVDHKMSIRKTYTAEDAERFIQHFNKEHDRVNAETAFIPTRNEFCGYCEAYKTQCQYSRKL